MFQNEGFLSCAGVSVQGVSVGGDPPTETPRTTTSGQYTSYWNAFFYIKKKPINMKKNKIISLVYDIDDDDDDDHIPAYQRNESGTEGVFVVWQ